MGFCAILVRDVVEILSPLLKSYHQINSYINSANVCNGYTGLLHLFFAHFVAVKQLKIE